MIIQPAISNFVSYLNVNCEWACVQMYVCVRESAQDKVGGVGWQATRLLEILQAHPKKIDSNFGPRFGVCVMITRVTRRRIMETFFSVNEFWSGNFFDRRTLHTSTKTREVSSWPGATQNDLLWVTSWRRVLSWTTLPWTEMRERGKKQTSTLVQDELYRMCGGKNFENMKNAARS